ERLESAFRPGSFGEPPFEGLGERFPVLQEDSIGGRGGRCRVDRHGVEYLDRMTPSGALLIRLAQLRLLRFGGSVRHRSAVMRGESIGSWFRSTTVAQSPGSAKERAAGSSLLALP